MSSPSYRAAHLLHGLGIPLSRCVMRVSWVVTLGYLFLVLRPGLYVLLI
jgi:hypothetical protein